MRDRHRDAVEPHTTSACHATGGEVREAYELWWRGYTEDDRWICVDENCKAEMTPCCWKRSDEHGPFLTKARVPAKLPPFFRAEGGHRPQCKVSAHSEPHDHMPSEYRLAVPTDYPARVKLSREPSGHAWQKPEDREDGSFPEEPNRRRLRSTYGIGEACEYYADHPDEHWRRLQVDGCPGVTYDECFVRLGTGNHKGIGKNWIFFDQLWLGGYIDLRAEPVVLPLLTTVYGKPRRLAIRTSNWPNSHREALKDRLLKAIIEVRKVIRERRPHRAWMFFYGREADFNQTEFDVGLEPGVDVLVRHLPQHWNLRTGNAYQTKRRLPILGSISSEPPFSSIVELPGDSPEPDAPPHHAEHEPGLAPPESSDPVMEKTSASTRTDITPLNEPSAKDAAKAGPPALEADLEEFHPIIEDAGFTKRGAAGAEGEAPVEELQLDRAAPEPEADIETSTNANLESNLRSGSHVATGTPDIGASDSMPQGAEPERSSRPYSGVAVDTSVAPWEAAPIMSNGRGQPAPVPSQPTAHISKFRRFIDRLLPSRFTSR